MSPTLLQIAKKLRTNQTLTEIKLWDVLRANNHSIKIKRQYPLVIDGNNFVADFYIPAKKVVIEIDGEIHTDLDIKRYDDFREDLITKAGYKVLRFTNDEVKQNIDEVLEKIKKHLSQQ